MAHFTHHTYLEMVEALNSVGIRETENQVYLIDKHKSVYDEMEILEQYYLRMIN